MLLTLPWFASIYAGRVDIVNCEPQYKRPRTAPPGWAKLKGTGMFDTGVGVGKEIGSNAKLMLLTGMLYMIMQIPAFMYVTCRLRSRPRWRTSTPRSGPS